jgi:hypothetical protein
MAKTGTTTSSQDFQIGINKYAGNLPQELAVIMRENSEALREMRSEMRAGITPKKVWYSRLPESGHR